MNAKQRAAQDREARIKEIAADFADSLHQSPLSRQTVSELRFLLGVDSMPAPSPTKLTFVESASVARRPARRVPSWKRIAEFWSIDCLECVRCGGRAGGVQKAHVIDRSGDGLDVPWNLAPLCGSCHGGQPAFSSGDELLALAWFGLPSLTDLPGTC